MADERWTSVFDLVSTLPRVSQDRLYATRESSPWTCRAIMQMLPALAKAIVLRLLCVDEPIAQQSLEQWAATSYVEKHRSDLRLLRDLHILLDADGGGGAADADAWDDDVGMADEGADRDNPLLRLNPTFRDSLRLALAPQQPTMFDGGVAAGASPPPPPLPQAPWRASGAELKRDKKRPTEQQLEELSVWRWNTLLKCVARSDWTGSLRRVDPPNSV